MGDQHSFAWTGYRASTTHSRNSSSSFNGLPYHCSVPESNVRSSLEDESESHSCEAPSQNWPSFATRLPPSAPSLDGGEGAGLVYDRSPSPSQFSSLQLSTHDPTTHNTTQHITSNPAYNFTSASNVSYSTHSNFTQFLSPPQSSPVSDSLVTTGPEPPVLYLTDEYKALAEPLSAWIADYLCKILVSPNTKRFMPSLVAFIRSVLWSTMLQPSAIFLALWYLSRFPVDFLPTQPSEDAIALKFRAALFGDGTSDEEACRKLFVCIAMLADRELHDNCFSSATWSEITHISMNELSALDYCSLHMLEHSLWIPQDGVRLHEIMSIQLEYVLSSLPATEIPGAEPTFLIPGERLLPLQHADEDLESDFDFDEDGPLRDEYVPRRMSSFSSRHSSEPHTTVSTPITPCSGACSSCGQQDYLQQQHVEWLSDSACNDITNDHRRGRRQSIRASDAAHSKSVTSMPTAGPSRSPDSKPCPVAQSDYSFSSRQQWLLT
ncbi:hypothetical protein BKA62DRAFT_690522 [Auriculariales sp. MPI-PUGE-AT-0066]|nr:hypothetical protein BKA62DRAFT_690522 [Auriculariales sp. MPI-PUGE-AT-0066]